MCYRHHHASTSSFREVGAATGGPTRFSCDDDEEVFGGGAIEEVLEGDTMGRCSRRSSGTVDGSNGCSSFGFLVGG
jgi:hypothetical protein